MSLILPDFDKAKKPLPPSYQRNRQAFRAPISSESMNLEDHQFSFDVAKLAANLYTYNVDSKISLDVISELKTSITDDLSALSKFCNNRQAHNQ